MNTQENIIIQLFTFIVPNILILSCSIYFTIKTKKTEGFLLSLGSLIYLLLNSFQVYMTQKIVNSNNPETISTYVEYYEYSKILFMFGHIIFSIGFLLLIKNNIQFKGDSENDIDSIGE